MPGVMVEEVGRHQQRTLSLKVTGAEELPNAEASFVPDKVLVTIYQEQDAPWEFVEAVAWGWDAEDSAMRARSFGNHDDRPDWLNHTLSLVLVNGGLDPRRP